MASTDAAVTSDLPETDGKVGEKTTKENVEDQKEESKVTEDSAVEESNQGNKEAVSEGRKESVNGIEAETDKNIPVPPPVEDSVDHESNTVKKLAESAQAEDVKEAEDKVEDVEDSESKIGGKPTELAHIEDVEDSESKIGEKPTEPAHVEDVKDEAKVEDIGEKDFRIGEEPNEPDQSADVKETEAEVKETDAKDTETSSGEKIVEVEDTKETEVGVEGKIVEAPVEHVKDTKIKSEEDLAELPLDDVKSIADSIISKTEAKTEENVDEVPVVEEKLPSESNAKIEEKINETYTVLPEPVDKLEETINEQTLVEGAKDLEPKILAELESKTEDAVAPQVETEAKLAEERIALDNLAQVATEAPISEVAKTLVQSEAAHSPAVTEVPDKQAVEESDEKQVRTLEAKLQEEKLSPDTPDETVQDNQEEGTGKKDDPIPEPAEDTTTRDTTSEKDNAKSKTPKQSIVKIVKHSLSKAKKAILGKSQNLQAKDAGAEK